LQVSLPNGQMFFEVAGEGVPLLLLHAGIADARMWDPQVENFAKEFRVVRCDLRGYGSSLLPNAQFSYHEDVLFLLNFLGIKEAWIVGASFGARVAVDLCLAQPERVVGLVLASPTVSGWEPSKEQLEFEERESELLERGALREATELNLRMWVDGPHRESHQVDLEFRRRVGEMQFRAFSQPFPENVSLRKLDPPAYQRLHEVRVPVLVISGALDVPAFVDFAGTLVQRVEGAEQVIIPGTAHLPNMEAPEQFYNCVREFIRRTDALMGSQ